MKKTVRRVALVGALAVIGVLAACDLNPQPLPPLDPEVTSGEGGTFGGGNPDARASVPAPSMDAGSGSDNADDSGLGDASSDGGDAGSDSGDAGDAS